MWPPHSLQEHFENSELEFCMAQECTILAGTLSRTAGTECRAVHGEFGVGFAEHVTSIRETELVCQPRILRPESMSPGGRASPPPAARSRRSMRPLVGRLDSLACCQQPGREIPGTVCVVRRIDWAVGESTRMAFLPASETVWGKQNEASQSTPRIGAGR